jgi:hypothetical protein
MKKKITKILRIIISIILAILPLLTYFAGRNSGIKDERSKNFNESEDINKQHKKEIRKLKKKSFFRGRQKFNEGLSDGMDLGIRIGRKQVLNEIRIKKIKEETGIDLSKYH